MKKNAALLLLLAAGLAALLLVTLDPLGLSRGVERDVGAQGEAPEVREGTAARLEGRGVPGRTGLPAWVDGEPVGVLDLGRGTASLAGTVTGGDAPLEGARVRVALAPPDDQRGVRTGPGGAFEIRGLPPGTFDVRAEAVDHVGRTVTAPALSEGQAETLPPIDLAPRPGRTDGLLVKVTDTFGRPVQGAKVVATTVFWALHLSIGPEMAGIPGAESKTAVTDERGEARLLALAPEKYDVVVMAPTWQTAFQPGVVVASGRLRPVFFQLVPGASIAGTVVDADGRPVAGAYVTGLHQPTFSGSTTARSGADGTFVLDGLREGRYWVIAFHEGHGEAQANPVASPSAGARLVMSGTGVLDLQVVGADGKPVPSYRVRPYQEQPFGYVYSISHPVRDEAGRFRLALPPATYHFAVQDDAGDYGADATATIRVGEETPVKVVLPASGVVRGVVVDASGNHVEGAEVYVRRGGFPPGPVREQYARTAADGSFEVEGLPLESVKLHVSHQKHAPTTFDTLPAPRVAAREVTIRLPKGATVRGRVRRGPTEGVARMQVNLMQGFDFSGARSSVTEDDGSYRFDAVGAGTYTLSTGRLEMGAGGVTRSGVAVPEQGEVVVDLDLGSAAAGATLRGVVRMGGQPVAGATVTLVDARGYDQMLVLETDEAGRFEGTGLQPGSVSVSVTSAGGLSTFRTTRVPESGDAPELAIDFGGATLQGRLVSPEGAPVSAAWIQVESPGDPAENVFGRVRATITSGTDGSFQAGGLEPGRYQLRITGTGYATLLTDPVDVAAERPTDVGAIRLAAGAALQGRVVDDAGQPLEDVTISLKDAAGRPVFLFSLTTTGSDGRYRLAGIEPGRYTIAFEAKGYAPTAKDVDLGAGGGTADGVLSRGGTLEARVLDDAGRPLAGARVEVLDAAGVPVRRTLSLVNLFDGSLGLTNEDGVARIPDLAPGAYTLRARKDGWVVSGDTPVARIEAAGTTPAVVPMAPTPGR